MCNFQAKSVLALKRTESDLKISLFYFVSKHFFRYESQLHMIQHYYTYGLVNLHEIKWIVYFIQMLGGNNLNICTYFHANSFDTLPIT